MQSKIWGAKFKYGFKFLKKKKEKNITLAAKPGRDYGNCTGMWEKLLGLSEQQKLTATFWSLLKGRKVNQTVFTNIQW